MIKSGSVQPKIPALSFWSRREFLKNAASLAGFSGTISNQNHLLASLDPKTEATSLNNLLKSSLNRGPYSVMDKKIVPPSGDRHDFMSIGPYWWPNPKEPMGTPYIKKDGQFNPEALKMDGPTIRNMVDNTTKLLLAGRRLNSDEGLKAASDQLRRWFLDPKTLMNPNLQYAQGIPGICEGRGIGLIDTASLCGLLWQLERAGNFSQWTKEDGTAFKQWVGNYLDWFLNSQPGKKESQEFNNHGTWYDAQVCSYAMFLGEKKVVIRQLERLTIKRVAEQIEPSGAMPHELARTLPTHYSLHNLIGFIFCAIHGRQAGISLFDDKTAYGQRLIKASQWFCGLAFGSKPQIAKQLKPLDPKATIWPFARLGELIGSGLWSEQLALIQTHAWERDLYRHIRTDEGLSE